MLAIYGIHFATSFFISQTPSVIGLHLKFSVVVVEIRPASHGILGGITFRRAPLSVARRLFGHQPAVGTLTEKLMSHSNGYITHPPLVRYA